MADVSPKSSLRFAFSHKAGKGFTALDPAPLLPHAGPVLLNLLVGYLTTSDEARLLGSRSAAKGPGLEGKHAGWQDSKGYVYALLLGLSALLKVALAHALALAVLCLLL